MLTDAKYLAEGELKARAEIKRRVSALFDVRQFILFGSKVRGSTGPDSDVDLLIVTARELDHGERHAVSQVQHHLR